MSGEFDFQRLWLILCLLMGSHSPLHLHFCLDKRHIPFSRCRSLDTATIADIRFDKTVLQFASFQTSQHFHTIVQSINIHFVVLFFFFTLLFLPHFGRIHHHRLKNSTTDRIKTVHTTIRVCHRKIFTFFQNNLFFLQPLFQFLKCQNRIYCAKHAGISYRLLLFRNTGTKKDNLCLLPIHFFDQSSVGDHRRDNRSKLVCQFRIILLHKFIHTWAASCNDIFICPFPQQFLILSRDKCRTF